MPRKAKKQIEEEKNVEERSSKLSWIIISVLVATIIFFAIAKMGPLGLIINNVFTYFFGSLYIIPLLTLFIYGIIVIFVRKENTSSIKLILGLLLINIVFIMFATCIANDVNSFSEYFKFLYEKITLLTTENAFTLTSGVVGNFLYVLFTTLVSRKGTIIMMIIMAVLSVILIIPTSVFKDAYSNFKEKLANSKIERERIREEKRIAFEKAEEERKLKLAEEMAAQAEQEENSFEEEIKEAPIEDVKEDTYSTDSDFLINLTANEIGNKVNNNSNVQEIIGEDSNSSDDTKNITKQKIKKVKRANGSYRVPKPLDEFLEPNPANLSPKNESAAKFNGEKIIEILQNFGIESSLIDKHIGPSVTKFEIKPESTVKINKINNFSDNIKMELAAKDIRIEAPIPGRSAVGIEVPNVEPIPVKMIDLMKNIPSDKKEVPLLFTLGKDLMGKSVYCDISKMPHLLIAGATGSGKSVCINSIITSFLLRSNPDEVKLVLVDPKKVEFTPYKDIPHLLWPIIDDAQMASNMLKKVVVMMEDRYDAFASVGVRNITSFNEFVDENNANLKNGESPINKMPYIVVIIDELADLMSIAGKDVELSIQRITQLARASGIHLIVATQRPSTDVITGLIKSNIPSRISFAVASSIDSRTILDATGAERLLGNGDMLYHPQGENAPMRLQGVYVTDREIQRITTYVKKQAQPQYEDSYYEFLTNMNGTTVMGAGSLNADSTDSLYDDVVEFVKAQQKASTSLLQRRFGIGYNRAARLIDTLEDRGIVGPANGSKPREVYLKQDEEQD